MAPEWHILHTCDQVSLAGQTQFTRRALSIRDDKRPGRLSSLIDKALHVNWVWPARLVTRSGKTGLIRTSTDT